MLKSSNEFNIQRLKIQKGLEKEKIKKKKNKKKHFFSKDLGMSS